MTRRVRHAERMGGRTLIVASATMAALTLPLAFATPSVAIARAESAIETVHVKPKGTYAAKPSSTAFDTAKTDYENAVDSYEQNELKALNDLDGQNMPTSKDYQALLTEQQGKITELDNQLNPMIQNLEEINTQMKNLNTTNQEALNKSLLEFNNLAATAKQAEQQMTTVEQTITAKRTADQQKIAGLNANVDTAKQAMEAKENDFNAFKPTYEQKASEYNNLKAQYDAKLSDINSQIDELKSQIEALPKDSHDGYDAANEKAASIQTQIDALTKERANVQTQYEATDASYKQLQAKYNDLQSAYQAAQAAVNAANAEITNFNSQIDGDNAKLQAEYNTAKTAYDQAVAKRTEMQNTIAQQKKAAQTENAKNAQIYATLEAKLNEYNQKIAEMNQKRQDLKGEIENTKNAYGQAYQKAKTAFDALAPLKQAAENAQKAYNAEVDTYNQDEQNQYDTLKADYDAKNAEYQKQLDALKQLENTPGNLTQAQGQGLDWGTNPNITVEEAFNNKLIEWENGPGVIVFDTTNNKHGIAVRLEPGQSNTVTYRGAAIPGMALANEPITEIKITYTNPNSYPIAVMANVNFREGFTQGWINTDKNILESTTGWSVQNNRFPKTVPVEDTYLVNTGVSMQFLNNGTPIEFSDNDPVVLFCGSLNYHNPGQIEGVTHWNFDKIIPIKDSIIVEETSIPGAAKPVPQINANNPILAGKAETPLKFDHPDNPNWYKLAIAGVKNTGNTIDFYATVVEPGGRTADHMNGIWFAFYSNSKLEALPKKPFEPAPPELLDQNTDQLPDPQAPVQPNIDVPDVEVLPNHAPLPPLVKVEDPNVQVPDAPVAPVQPIPGKPLNMIPAIPQPAALDIAAPVAPEAVPEVPKVPEKPVLPKKHIPKTADASVAGLAGLMAAAGAFLTTRKNKEEK